MSDIVLDYNIISQSVSSITELQNIDTNNYIQGVLIVLTENNSLYSLNKNDIAAGLQDAIIIPNNLANDRWYKYGYITEIPSQQMRFYENPFTPNFAAGSICLYVDQSDGKLKFVDQTGNVRVISYT